MVLGLTGGYCAGKDAAARILAARGFSVIDVDAVGHEVLGLKAAEVAAAFGPSVRREDGTIDRRALGRIVFSDPAALRRHEAIVHPAMVEIVKARAAARQGDTLINAAILFRLGLEGLCDAVLCVTAPLPVRLLRAMRRDSASPGRALARIRSQKGLCPKSHGSAVDILIVRNSGSLLRLERGLAAALERIKKGKAS
jgi:dephospho-CoA kinase